MAFGGGAGVCRRLERFARWRFVVAFEPSRIRCGVRFGFVSLVFHSRCVGEKRFDEVPALSPARLGRFTARPGVAPSLVHPFAGFAACFVLAQHAIFFRAAVICAALDWRERGLRRINRIKQSSFLGLHQFAHAQNRFRAILDGFETVFVARLSSGRRHAFTARRIVVRFGFIAG